MTIGERAAAKINLYLQMTGRRADGYHLLDSWVGFTEAGDLLEAAPAGQLRLALAGPFASRLSAVDNSVFKAALTLRSADSAGADLKLIKCLPVASGIGGGSADAAAALRLLPRLWNQEIPAQTLQSLALSLGADVPACLASRSLFMSGIGETLEDAPPLTGIPVVLVNPGRPLATKQVFAAFSGEYSRPVPRPAAFASLKECVEFLRGCRNDLEEAATGLMPEIAEILEALRAQGGCLLARMSGSGATCFGIFGDKEGSAKAAASLRARFKGGWVQETVFL